MTLFTVPRNSFRDGRMAEGIGKVGLLNDQNTKRRRIIFQWLEDFDKPRIR